MKLDASQWNTLSHLLEEALDLDATERTAWLERQAGIDPSLRAALRELLAAHAGNGPSTFAGDLPTFPVPNESVCPELACGVCVGPYRLVRLLGRGGMGEVWLAERADRIVSRQVALKLPATTMPHRKLAERFAREREILARLTHPNIARLYDAGFAADGHPYLALEFVEGVPLTQSCDDRHLGVDARIALFLQVLAAVQYAHNNLVIHRDLKPSNILVTREGNVKLLDFGIAKLLANDGSAEETDITRVGGHALTLEYAAPEQVTGAPLTTAVDVYTLGVLLYELLTGARPYRLKRGSLGEIEEAIASVDPIPLSRATYTDAALAARSTTAPRLRRALAGDLDTIAQKALRKEPEERYASAGSLADDLSRHRAHLPVTARPASFWYRIVRFVRRNALAVSAASAIAVLLVAASVVSLALMHRAEREATVANAVKNFMTDIFRASTIDQRDDKLVRDMTAPELLDRGARNIGTSLDDAPAAKASLLQLFGEMYEQLGFPDRSLRMHEQSVAVAAGAHGKDSREYALALLEKAWVTYVLDKNPDPPLAMIEEARQVLAARAPDSADYAEALYMEAHVVANSDVERAVARGEEAVHILDRAGATDKRAGFARLELGGAYRLQGNLDAAARTMADGAVIFERLYGPDHPDVAFLRLSRALVLTQQLRLVEADEDYKRAIASTEKRAWQHAKSAAFYRLQRALVLASRGRFDEAYPEMNAIAELRAGANDGFALSDRQVQVLRAATRAGQGDTDRAIAEIEAASTDSSAFPRRTIVSPSVLHEILARAYLARGDVASARAHVEQARTLAAQEGVPPVRQLWIALRDSEVTAREGRVADALALLAAAETKAGIVAKTAEASSQLALVRARILAGSRRYAETRAALNPWIGDSLPAGVELPVGVRAEMLLLDGEALAAGSPAAARARLMEADAALRASDVPGSARRTRAVQGLARLAG